MPSAKTVRTLHHRLPPSSLARHVAGDNWKVANGAATCGSEVDSPDISSSFVATSAPCSMTRTLTDGKEGEGRGRVCRGGRGVKNWKGKNKEKYRRAKDKKGCGWGLR